MAFLEESDRKANMPPEIDYGGEGTETELTLGLPGGRRAGPSADHEVHAAKPAMKRGFSETVDLNLGDGDADRRAGIRGKGVAEKPPATKAQVVGWPPVRSYRVNAMKSCTYVKVAVDGAPYLRKVDLEMYDGYQQLLKALEDMFSTFTVCNFLGESKLVDKMNGTEYVPTYEDKDRDWMLVGDVPWKMFVESCKRMRLMKSSEATELGKNSKDSREVRKLKLREKAL